MAPPMAAGSRIAIIGAGIAGLALAGALSARGWTVSLYEQASRLARSGAGIQQSPNAVKVLRGWGLEPVLRSTGFRPADFVHRDAVTGEVTNRIPLGPAAEERYGAPHLLLHRGDLQDALLATVPDRALVPAKQVVALHRTGDGVGLSFADGTRAHADAVIGADGVRSTVRELLLGPQRPRFSGRVGYRATIPVGRLAGLALDDNTKWWGPDQHLIVYHTTAARDEVYVMATVEEPDFDLESWSAKGDVDVLRRRFAGSHPTVERLLASVREVHKWALVDRDPLPRWSEGNIIVIGDAAHPMLPHMGQGAAMAVEDAAVLVRCLEIASTWAEAFDRTAVTRRDRVAEVQAISAGNSFARTGRDAIDWVYGHDARTVPLL